MPGGIAQSTMQMSVGFSFANKTVKGKKKLAISSSKPITDDYSSQNSSKDF